MKILFKIWTNSSSDPSQYYNWFIINQTQTIGVLQVGQIIQSTFSHTLNLLLLPPYPTNNFTRSYIPLETSDLTWSSS